MENNTIKIYNPMGKGWLGTQYEIDGKEIENVKAVDFRVAVDELPRFTFETYGLPDIEMDGEVRFQFTPKTIEEAARVICESFTKGGENYNALVSSIKSVIDEYRPNSENGFRIKEAQDIADRILGIEK